MGKWREKRIETEYSPTVDLKYVGGTKLIRGTAVFVREMRNGDLEETTVEFPVTLNELICIGASVEAMVTEIEDATQGIRKRFA